jgi:predicted transcriptional regulator of viral defense system
LPIYFKKAFILNEFLVKNPVFSTAQVRRFLSARGTTGKRSAEAWLAYYQKNGCIVRIKRGLYAAVPPDANPKTFIPDAFLLAARMTSDAVLVYHTALEFHGRAYSVHRQLTYQTASPPRLLTFGDWQFQPVRVPSILQRKGKADFGVVKENRDGVKIPVTSLERTLVDVLHRPIYSGSWEEIWRSLESVEFFDLEQVIEYTLLLENATTTAKVGFFLEQHKEELMVEDKHLAPLRSLRPKQPHYFTRGKKKSGHWVKDWNLVIPDEILNRSWAEII